MMNDKVFYIIFLFAFNLLYTQIKEDSIYSKLILDIKNSEIIDDYAKEKDCGKKICVSKFNNSICEYSIIFHKTEINLELLKHCENINLLDYEAIENKFLVNKNESNPALMLQFSEIFDGYIVAELSTIKSKSNKSIIFLYKICSNSIEKIYESYYYLN